MKILIIGDSFAADWTVKYDNVLGWPNLIAQKHDVTNLAQAGVSEYRILKQLESVNVEEFDLVIASHTSVSRIPTRCHPVHSNDPLHKSADLILSDVDYHASRLRNWFNRALKAAKDFYIYHYDAEYQDLVYELIRTRINSMCKDVPVIAVTNLITDQKFNIEPYAVTIDDIQQKHPGLANHLSPEGNIQVATRVLAMIKEITK